jgi:hypothetical protein
LGLLTLPAVQSSPSASEEVVERPPAIVGNEVAMALPSLRGGDDKDVWAVRRHETDNFAHITLFICAERYATPSSSELINVSDILGLFAREAGVAGTSGPAAIARVWHELDRSNSILYSSELASLSNEHAAPPDNADIEQLRQRISSVQSMRLKYINYMLAISRIDTSSTASNSQPQAVIQALDGMANAMLLYQIDILNRTNKEAQESAGRRQIVVQNRERTLVAIATILLLPTLWFSFLGTNVFPQYLFGLKIQSDLSVLIAALVAGGLSAIGLVVVLLIFRKRKIDHD